MIVPETRTQGHMLWEWLTSISTGRSSGTGALPALQKPLVDPQQQQQQQQTLPGAAAAGQHAEKEYCLRMAFKLTPKYSSKLQVITNQAAGDSELATVHVLHMHLYRWALSPSHRPLPTMITCMSSRGLTDQKSRAWHVMWDPGYVCSGVETHN